jgi:predicted nucleic acid-binding protein
LIEPWVSPAILEEYADVLGDQPEFVAEIVESCRVCHPLTELNVIRHEPDNRFLECALAAGADFIVTVNTAPGHFDREKYQRVSVVRPGEFLNLPAVGRLVKKLTRS